MNEFTISDRDAEISRLMREIAAFGEAYERDTETLIQRAKDILTLTEENAKLAEENKKLRDELTAADLMCSMLERELTEMKLKLGVLT